VLSCANGTNCSGTILMTGGSLQIYGGGTAGALVLGGSGSNNVGTFTQSGGLSIFGKTVQTNFIGNVIGSLGNYTVSGGTNQIKGSLLLGYVPNSTGNVWITGGQLSNTVSILNGYSGVGAMTVSNGAWWAGVNVIGYNSGASGTLNIQGGTGNVALATTVGLTANSTGSVIMSGGCLVSPAVFLCSNGTLAASANFLVCSGAVLEANTVVSPNSSGSGGFSNLNSGVWQFTSNTPAVTNNNSNIVVSNATIAFRAIANADVKGNWTGSQLTNVLWQGTNTFCLNAASNTMAINQNYTFASGLGSTNYVALKLINGAIYRNGNVNIGTNGNGGSLMVQGGPCTIASNLTMNSLSTLALTVGSSSDYLIVTNGTANLGLATLQLTFNTCPTNLYPLTIVQANAVQNSFGSPQIRASYLGSNYTLQVRSSNNSIYLTWPGPPGTGIFFW